MTTPLSLERIENVADALLVPSHVALDTHPVRLNQQAGGLTLDPYVINNGQPEADTGFGVQDDSDITMAGSGITIVQGIPSPLSISTGADYRWLPYSQYIALNYNGYDRWFYMGGTADTHPQLYCIREYGATVDPKLHPTYSYTHRGLRVSRPAYTMNQKGMFGLQTQVGAANYTASTITMVLVPHAGPGEFYCIFDSGNVSNPNYTLSLRYAKGLLQIFDLGGRLLEYKTSLEHGEPIIVIMGFDGTTKTGRLVVVDRRRTSRSFSSHLLSGLDFDGTVGGRYQTGTTTPDWSRVGDMDILEVDMWLGKMLSFHEMEQQATLMAAVYQVGP